MPDRLKRIPSWARTLLFTATVVVTASVAVDLATAEPSAQSLAITPCVVDPATMAARGCSLLRSDTAKIVDPRPGRWGTIECASESRELRLAKGGDPRRRADGKKQGDFAFRRLTVIDGDDFYGERCELGRNEQRYGVNRGSQTSGTFELYGDGEHMITFFSQRYPATFPLDASSWQVILQMKQTEPFTASDSVLTPALALQISGNRLRLYNFEKLKWAVPAAAHGVWVRYALDVVYSADPAIGSVKVYVDRNGDGDALDKREQSPVMHMATLATDAVTGLPVPDHLRIGIYHDPSIACPPPLGCSVDVDNVQVVG